MTETKRQHLIRRIQSLPEERLDNVERLLDLLDCGDSSPLSQSGWPSSTSNATRQAASIAAAVKSGNELPHSKDWPRAPVHRISEHGTYIVTAGTLHKQHRFAGAERLDLLESTLLRIAREFGWHLEAWAVFSNHYHFVGSSELGSVKLDMFTKQLHAETAGKVNGFDAAPGRQVWHNYWDTKLTFEKSYLARLNYVHQNPVRHRLVPVANQYNWCSAAWFERTATLAQVKTIYGFKTDKVKVHDDFDPI